MIEEHLRGDSVIHRLDPRLKIVTAFVLAVVIALAPNIRAAAAGLLAGIALTVAARIPGKELLKRLLAVNEFVLLLWLVIPLTHAGPPALSWRGFSVSAPGLAMTASLTLKANAAALILIGMLATSSIFDLGHGLIHLGAPKKLVFLFFLMYRYAWVTADEYDRIIRAVKARGFKMAASLHAYRTVGYVIGGLLIKSHRRAERLYQAMVCRGFDGTFWVLDHFRFGRRDLAAAAVFFIGAALIAFIAGT